MTMNELRTALDDIYKRSWGAPDTAFELIPELEIACSDPTKLKLLAKTFGFGSNTEAFKQQLETVIAIFYAVHGL